MSGIWAWELSQYEGAAVQMCFRLGRSPHEMRQTESGAPEPAWVELARRMHEHRVMLECMHMAGLPPPV